MNRIRFSKAPGTAAEPATPAGASPFEARQPAPEPVAANPSQAALASKEDRDVIEHVQSRLLAEPSNPTGKREADYFVRRIATLVSEPAALIGFADSGAHIRNMAFYSFPLRTLRYGPAPQLWGVNFVRAIESFDTPAIIALPARIEVFTTKIWREALGSFPTNHNLAAAYGVGILAVALVFVYLYRRFTSQVESFSTVTGKGFRPHQIALGPWLEASENGALFLNIGGQRHALPNFNEGSSERS